MTNRSSSRFRTQSDEQILDLTAVDGCLAAEQLDTDLRELAITPFLWTLVAITARHVEHSTGLALRTRPSGTPLLLDDAGDLRP